MTEAPARPATEASEPLPPPDKTEAGPAQGHQSGPPNARSHRRSATHHIQWSLVCKALIALGVILGIVLRAWYLTHVPTSSDEAVAGLMAQGALHGHLVAFYWGQDYGGVEPYVVAAMVWVFGSGGWVLGLTAALLAALASVVVWRVARRLVSDPLLAGLAGALSWAGSEIVMKNSTVEYGFRGVVLVCGLVCILFSLRILDGERRLADFAVLGLSAGVGWWASPELAYFAVPSAALFIGGVVKGPPLRRVGYWSLRLGFVVVGAGLGALPWLWANAGDGFKSLSRNSFVGVHSTLNTGYSGRLQLFFDKSLSMLLGVRYVGTFDLVGGVVLLVLALILLVVSLVICLSRPGRTQAMAAAVLAFPFLYAFSPATYFWEDGRYVTYLWPLLCLVFIPACDLLPQIFRLLARRPPPPRTLRRSWSRLFGVGASLLFFALALVTFEVPYLQANNASFFSGWTYPDSPSQASADALVSSGLRAGYADYWISYKLDYLSGNRLHYTPAQGDIIRNAALYGAVTRAHPETWLFVAPDSARTGMEQFSLPQPTSGPSGLSQSSFVADLRKMGVAYRVKRAGILNAVTPRRDVVLLPNLKVVLVPTTTQRRTS